MEDTEVKQEEKAVSDTAASGKKSKKKKIMNVVKIIFLIAVFFFLGKYFYDNWDTIKNLEDFGATPDDFVTIKLGGIDSVRVLIHLVVN